MIGKAVQIIVVSGLVFALAAPAAAQTPNPYKALVLDVVGEGVEEPIEKEVSAVIWAEVDRNPAYNLVKDKRESLSDLLFALGCEEPTAECMSALAEALKVERIIYARLIATDELHDLTVNVFDYANKRVVRRWSKRFTPDREFSIYFAQQMKTFLGGQAPPPTPTRLRVSSNVSGALVYVDGKEMGPVPWRSTKISAGKKRVEVRAEGYTYFDKQFELLEGEDRFYNAVLKPLSSVVIPKNPNEVPDFELRGRLVTYGYVVLALGAAAVGTGGVFGYLSQRSEDRFEKTQIESKAQKLRDDGVNQATTANILYGLGGVAIISGGLLVIAGFAELEEAEAQAEGAALLAGPDTLGVTWTLSW
jgi:hypothetical protein